MLFYTCNIVYIFDDFNIFMRALLCWLSEGRNIIGQLIKLCNSYRITTVLYLIAIQ